VASPTRRSAPKILYRPVRSERVKAVAGILCGLLGMGLGSGILILISTTHQVGSSAVIVFGWFGMITIVILGLLWIVLSRLRMRCIVLANAQLRIPTALSYRSRSIPVGSIEGLGAVRGQQHGWRGYVWQRDGTMTELLSLPSRAWTNERPSDRRIPETVDVYMGHVLSKMYEDLVAAQGPEGDLVSLTSGPPHLPARPRDTYTTWWLPTSPPRKLGLQ
jgi:hypothetical protein